MVKIKPLGNRVLVQRSKAPTSKGGFYCPILLKKNPVKGK